MTVVSLLPAFALGGTTGVLLGSSFGEDCFSGAGSCGAGVLTPRGVNPGGVGSSSKGTGFPLACIFKASSNCLQIRPYLRAFDVFPSSSAATFVRR